MYSYDIYALTSYDSDLTGEVNYQSRVEEIANMETESLLTLSGSTKGTRTVAEFDKSGRKWRTVTSGVTGETAKFRIVSNDGTFYLALVLGDGSTSIVK